MRLWTALLSPVPLFHIFSLLNDLGWLSKMGLLRKVILFIKIVYFSGSQILARGMMQIHDQVVSSHYGEM